MERAGGGKDTGSSYSLVTTRVTLNPYIREPHLGGDGISTVPLPRSRSFTASLSPSAAPQKTSNCNAGACDCLRQNRCTVCDGIASPLPPSCSFSRSLQFIFPTRPTRVPCAFLPSVGRGEGDKRDGHNNLYAWRVYTCGCTGKPVRLTISHACMCASSSPSPLARSLSRPFIKFFYPRPDIQ